LIGSRQWSATDCAFVVDLAGAIGEAADPVNKIIEHCFSGHRDPHSPNGRMARYAGEDFSHITPYAPASLATGCAQQLPDALLLEALLQPLAISGGPGGCRCRALSTAADTDCWSICLRP
jgi:hypothetical protein